jgi:hypothetical protein
LHLYLKDGELFREIELLGQTGGIFIHSNGRFHRYLWEKSHPLKVQQDSLIGIYCQDQHLPVQKWKEPGSQPLLLKAKQELDDYAVYDIGHILKKTGDYKITFEPTATDPAYSPAQILSFHKYLPMLIYSNTLFYENAEYESTLKQ